jgi:hypothetical protein
VVKRGGELVLHNPVNTPDDHGNDNNPETTPRANKRKRDSEVDLSHEQSQSGTDSSTAGHAKKPRRAGPLARSGAIEAGRDGLSEVNDSYEHTTSLPTAPTVTERVSVVVDVPAGFDRRDYQTPYVVESSQSQAVDSSNPSTPQSSRDLGFSPASTGIFAHLPLKSSRRSTRTAEKFVIPDSQDEGASDPYEPSQSTHQSTAESTQETHFATRTEAGELSNSYGARLKGLDSLESGLEESLNPHELSHLRAASPTLNPHPQSLDIETGDNFDAADDSYRQVGETSSQLEASFLSNHASEPLTSQSSRLLTPGREDRISRADSDYPSSQSDLNTTQRRTARLSSYGISPSHLPSPSIENGSSALASPTRVTRLVSVLTLCEHADNSFSVRSLL